MKKYGKKLRRELRDAYVAIDEAQPYTEYHENELHRRIGEYYGLRKAYSMLTGLPEIVIGQKVTSWFVQSEHYQERHSDETEVTEG